MNLPPLKTIWNDVVGVGNNLVHAGENAAALVPNEIRLAAANLTGNQTAAQNARTAIGGNIRQIQPVSQPIMRTFPEALTSIVKPFGGTYTPGSYLEQQLFGKTPVQNIQSNVASTWKNHKNAPLWERAGLTALDVPAQVLQVAPVTGTVAKAAKVGMDMTAAAKAEAAAKGISDETGAVGKLADEEKPNVAQSTPTGVANVKVSNPLDSAVARVGGDLDKPFNFESNPTAPPHVAINDLINGVHAADRNAVVQAEGLGSAIREALPDATDRASVTHTLEGEAPANEKVAQVAGTLKALNDRAFASRQRWDSNIQPVEQYAPRFVTKAPKGESSSLKIGVLKPGATITDLLRPIRSRFNLGREVMGFEGEDGSVLVGKAKSLGLQDVGGAFEDENGMRYKPMDLTVKQLNAGSDIHGYKFREDIAKNMEDYHRDTLIANNHAYAADLLKNNAEQFGLRHLEDGEEPVEGENYIIGVGGMHGWVAPDEVANQITRELGHVASRQGPLPIRILKQAYWRATDLATQLIVRNPLIHGQNQAVQALIASGDFDKLGVPGMTNMVKARATLAGMGKEDIMNLVDEMAKEGMYLPDYGKSEWGVLARMTGGVSKYSSRAMASIDLHLRAAAYIAGKQMGLDGKEISSIVNHYMGDGMRTRGAGIGLFVHYLKTISRSLYGQATHPIEHAGANVATAAIAATYYSLDKALQKATGNKNAYITPAGELGLGKEVFKTGRDIFRNGVGNFPTTVGTSSIVLNHTNPILKEIIQQVIHTDLFTGQDIKNDRLGHAVKGTISPASIAMQSEGLGGHKSLPELGLNQLRVFTPHAPGAPATPDISFFNIKGAKPEKGPDVTGYQPMMAAIEAKNKLMNAVSGDKRATDAVNAYLDRDKNSQGATIELNPQEALGVANLLSSNPKALEEMKKYKDAVAGHDPLWDLSTADIKKVLDYQGTRSTDPEKAVKLDLVQLSNGQSLADFVKGRDQWYQDNAGSFNGNTVPAPGTPQYPNITPDLQAKLDQMSNMTDSKTRAQFIADNPDLRDILNQLFNYKNATGVAQGGQALKAEQFLSPQLQDALNSYDKLPKGTGARSSWIRANSGLWNQIQSALSDEELYNISKEGAKNMYQGEQPSQTLLKDIGSLGKYGIAVDSTGRYVINPQMAYSQGGGGGGGKVAKWYTGLAQGRRQEKTRERIRVAHPVRKPKVYVKVGKKPSLRTTAKRVKIKG